MSPTARRRLVRAGQILASLAVLWVLGRDVQAARLRDVLDQASLGWLLAALGIKAAALMVHELRLWVALPAPRPPVLLVVVIGLVAGMLNLILPARGGDIAAIAMLNRAGNVRATAATAAVGIVTFMEAATFGVMLLLAMLGGAAQWRQILGPEAAGRALTWLSVVTVGGILAIAALILAGRLMGRHHTGPLAMIRDTASDVSVAFATPREAAVHIGLSVVQVVATLAAFTLALPAVGLHVPQPWLVASGVLAISSAASVVLPPTLAAGPAAAAAVVLSFFGAPPEGVLAYAGAWWLVAHVPAVGLGLPGMWSQQKLFSA